MSKTSGHTILRYALLQLPELIVFTLVLLVLKAWFSVPLWLFIVLIVVWIAKDVIIYPFVWRAYDTSESGRSKGLVGEKGTVKEKLDPSGYIVVGSELWRAQLVHGNDPLEEGRKVKVKDAKGLTLLVEPDGEEAD